MFTTKLQSNLLDSEDPYYLLLRAADSFQHRLWPAASFLKHYLEVLGASEALETFITRTSYLAFGNRCLLQMCLLKVACPILLDNTSKMRSLLREVVVKYLRKKNNKTTTAKSKEKKPKEETNIDQRAS